MRSESPVSILQAARQGKLRHYLNQYVEFCYSQSLPSVTNRRPAHRFPNFAGFCYFMGCGMTELTRLQSEYPEEANYIETVMEDEALNSPFMPASVLLLYLKARLDYGTPQETRSRKPKQPVQIQCIYVPPEPETNTEQKAQEETPPPPETIQATAHPTQQLAPEHECSAQKSQQTPIAQHPRQLYASHLHAKQNQARLRLSKPTSRYFMPPRPPPIGTECSLTIS